MKVLQKYLGILPVNWIQLSLLIDLIHFSVKPNIDLTSKTTIIQIASKWILRNQNEASKGPEVERVSLEILKCLKMVQRDQQDFLISYLELVAIIPKTIPNPQIQSIDDTLLEVLKNPFDG